MSIMIHHKSLMVKARGGGIDELGFNILVLHLKELAQRICRYDSGGGWLRPN